MPARFGAVVRGRHFLLLFQESVFFFFKSNATAFYNVICFKLSKKWLIAQAAFFPFYIDSFNSQTVSKHNSPWFCPLETMKRLGLVEIYILVKEKNLSASQNRGYFSHVLLIRMFTFHLVMTHLKELTISVCRQFGILHTIFYLYFFVISLQFLENNSHRKYYVLNTKYLSASKTNIRTMTEIYMPYINSIQKTPPF